MINLLHKYCDGNDLLLHILTTHSEQVAQHALRIVDAHPELEVDRPFIREAALLHDIGITLCNAPRIHCLGTHQYIEHGYLGAQILRSEGLEPHARVAERHTGTGLTHEQITAQQLPIPPGDYRPETLEEQIICYADKFYSKTRLTEQLTYEHIRKKLAKFGPEGVAQFDQWHSLFNVTF